MPPPPATVTQTEWPQADSPATAVLVILSEVTNGPAGATAPAARSLLEDVTYRLRDREPTVLETLSTSQWRRRLYESLAYLEQTGCLRRLPDGYQLTELGDEAARAVQEGLDGHKEIREAIREVVTGCQHDTNGAR